MRCPGRPATSASTLDDGNEPSGICSKQKIAFMNGPTFNPAKARVRQHLPHHPCKLAASHKPMTAD